MFPGVRKEELNQHNSELSPEDQVKLQVGFHTVKAF